MKIYNLYIIYSTIIISFLITFFLGKILLPILRKLKFGQKILKIGPSWHQKKEGIPTMGGISFIIAITIAIFVFIPLYYKISELNGFQAVETPLMRIKLFAGLTMAVLFGLIGFMDDFTKIAKKRNKGLKAIEKLIMEFLVSGGYLFVVCKAKQMYNLPNSTKILLPFLGNIELGIFYWIFSSLITVGIVNAVNLTDGIDGLCASTTTVQGIFFMLIASIFGMAGLSIQAAALIGGSLGFLVWNRHPAKVFMGDTGSLFLGGLISAFGFILELHVILIIMSGIYICEMFSVIFQVAYFKLTHGKRLFKMSPIHHHFEMCGWSENKICFVFSAITVVCGIISVLLSIFACFDG